MFYVEFDKMVELGAACFSHKEIQLTLNKYILKILFGFDEFYRVKTHEQKMFLFVF